MALSFGRWLVQEVKDCVDDALLAFSQTSLGRLTWDVPCALVVKLSPGLLLGDQGNWAPAAHGTQVRSAHYPESDFDGLLQESDQQDVVEAKNHAELEQSHAAEIKELELVQNVPAPVSLCPCPR